jgi:hypothetical protein
MDRLWWQLQRPLLVEVVAAYDRGAFIIDPVTYAAALRQPTQRVRAALAALQVAGFIEAQPHQGATVAITRICPLARQILRPAPTSLLPTTTDSAEGSSADG